MIIPPHLFFISLFQLTDMNLLLTGWFLVELAKTMWHKNYRDEEWSGNNFRCMNWWTDVLGMRSWQHNFSEISYCIKFNATVFSMTLSKGQWQSLTTTISQLPPQLKKDVTLNLKNMRDCRLDFQLFEGIGFHHPLNKCAKKGKDPKLSLDW